jgi:DNA-binding PadR family transcriptional regulator
MSVVRLLVLGVIRAQGQAHGYAVQRELMSWKVETWTRVRPGSLYHALKQLEKEGLLEERGTEHGEGPGRTLYALSDAGDGEFRQLLDKALGSFDLEELGAGVAFMQALPRAHVLKLLRAQQKAATLNRDHLDRWVSDFEDRSQPPHTADLLELWSGSLTATAAWTARIIQRLEAGEYVMAGEKRKRPTPPKRRGSP